MLVSITRFSAARLTASVTGGWGEKGLKTGNSQSSDKTPKNAPSPSRPVHAVLACLVPNSTLA